MISHEKIRDGLNHSICMLNKLLWRNEGGLAPASDSSHIQAAVNVMKATLDSGLGKGSMEKDVPALHRGDSWQHLKLNTPGAAHRDRGLDKVAKDISESVSRKAEEAATKKVQSMVNDTVSKKIASMDFSEVEGRMVAHCHRLVDDRVSRGLTATLSHINNLQRKVREIEKPKSCPDPRKAVTQEDYDSLKKKYMDLDREHASLKVAHNKHKALALGIMYGSGPNYRQGRRGEVSPEYKKTLDLLSKAGLRINELQEINKGLNDRLFESAKQRMELADRVRNSEELF